MKDALHELGGAIGKLKTILSLMEDAEAAELKQEYIPMLKNTLAGMEAEFERFLREKQS